MKNAKWLGAFLVIGCAAVFSGGCYREHLSRDFGEKSREFLARQRVHEKANEAPPQGLDSEEAVIIHQTYREDIGGKREASEESGAKVLLVEDKKNAK